MSHKGGDAWRVRAEDGDEARGTSWTVEGAQAFILKISTVLGLAPLQFEARTDGYRLRVSAGMCLYSYVLITTLVACTVGGLCAELRAGVRLAVRMTSRTAQLVSTCDVLAVALTASAGVYQAPSRMRNMLEFMESVAAVDAKLGTRTSRAAERRLCGMLLTVLACFTLLIADDFCFYALQARHVGRHWDVVTNYAGFYMLWYLVLVLELQFAVTALGLLARLRVINDALERTAARLLTSEKVSEPVLLNVFGGARPAIPPAEAVRRLAVLHGTLTEVLRRVESSYGLPLVIVLASTLLHLIVTPYFFIMEILISTHRIHFLVLQFLWCATHVLRMLIIVEPCHYTNVESKRTELLVCRLMRMSWATAGSLPSRLELFSRQLMLQPVSYSPMGLCTLGRPLVATVLGAVSTYLVILIQFQRYDA